MNAPSNEPGLIFQEQQHFSKAIRIFVLAVTIVVVAHTCWITWASWPTLNGQPLWPMLIGVGILILCNALIQFSKLITQVRPDGLYVRFVPFHLSFKKIDLSEVTDYQALTYRPLLEYGGWGMRYRWKGRAYNASGNRGVRLDFRNGRHLLIGSQRPEELVAAIDAIAHSKAK